MIREEVIQVWTGLKEKINDLSLSESDQQIAKYLASCPLIGFFDNFRESNEFDELEKKIQEIIKKLSSFNPDNETITDWWFLALQYARTILDWVQQKKFAYFYKKELESKIEEVD